MLELFERVAAGAEAPVAMKVLHVVAIARAAGCRGVRLGAGRVPRAGRRRPAGGGAPPRAASDAVSFSAPSTEVGAAGMSVPGIRMKRGRRRGTSGARSSCVSARRRAGARRRAAEVRAGGATRGHGADRLPADRRRRRSSAASELRGARTSRLMRRAARVVAVADALRVELVERFGLAPARVVAIPNGVDVDVWSRRAPATRSGTRSGSARTRRSSSRSARSRGRRTRSATSTSSRRRPSGDRGLVHVIAGDGPLRAERRGRDPATWSAGPHACCSARGTTSPTSWRRATSCCSPAGPRACRRA